MLSFLQNNWLKILNTLILLGLGIYSFIMTKKVEFLKSQLNVSSDNKKWFIKEQNKALIKLSEEIFSLIHKLKKFPEYNQVNFNLKDKFHGNMLEEFSTHKLNLDYLTILFNKNETLGIVEAYYKILEELFTYKQDILNELENRHRNVQIRNEDMPQDLIEQGFNFGDFSMQPDDYYKMRKTYFSLFQEKVYGKEYKAFTEYVRNFLKSSNRLN